MKYLGRQSNVDDISRLGDPESITLALGDDITAIPGTARWYPPYTVEVMNVALWAAGNQTITVDLNRSGTTMFVTQGNRPALSASTTDLTNVPDAATDNQVTTSQYLTVDVDSVTGTPDDIYVRVDFRRVA